MRSRQRDIASDKSPRPASAASTASACGLMLIVKITEPSTYVSASSPNNPASCPADNCTTCERNNSAGGTLMKIGGTRSQSR